MVGEGRKKNKTEEGDKIGKDSQAQGEVYMLPHFGGHMHYIHPNADILKRLPNLTGTENVYKVTISY